MEVFLKVFGVIVTSSLLLLGTATLIQLIEQLVREPRVSNTRH